MLNLLLKDFKLMFASQSSSRSKRVLSAISSVLFVGCFAAIEVFLYSAILTKIKTFVGAPVTFTCLFLAVISVLMIINGILRASKLFFDKQDAEQLSTHPVSDGMLIFSKMVFLFFNHFLTSLIFVYPIFVAYGVIFSKGIWFYYGAIFYPVLSFLFEMGVALILVYPVWIFTEFLKKHVVIEFAFAVVGLFVLSYLYSIILNEFINMVIGNSMSLLFTEESMASLGSLVQKLVPIKFLISSFISGAEESILPYLCISIGVFILGTAVSVTMFNYVRNISVREKNKKQRSSLKVRSVNAALARKELALITKDPDYILSFSGLLVVQPFLLYLIVVAMRAIFNSGTFLYYTTLFPNFASLVSIFVVIMVTLIINSGANRYLSMEARTVKTLKIIPVSYRRQLLIKVLIPFLMSEVSMIISLAVIMIDGVMAPLYCLFTFLLGTVSLLVFDAISLTEELKIRHGKPRSSFLSTLYAYLLPLAFMLTGLVLSYLGVSLTLIAVCAFGVFLLLGAPILISLMRNMGKWFLLLETIY